MGTVAMAKGRWRDPSSFWRSRAGAAPVLGRAGSTPFGRRRREGERGMAAGGGGGGGAGKETAGATTPSDLNNFQFQEGKRELEKYRRCDLAEGREEAPKGSRVCGGASLDTAKTAGEWEQGWGRPSEG